MEPHWIKRRAHIRHVSKGRSVPVHESWIRYSPAKQPQERSQQKCPYCGAKITTVPMPNGGWAHFEGGKGLKRVKHPCFHLGEGLSIKRDDQTPDLFDYLEVA